MKKLNLTYALVALIILFIAACKKDKSNGNAANSAKEFAALFGPQEQKMQINADISNTFTLKSGTKITIPVGAFKKNGTVVTGNVTVSAMEFLTRSSILFGGTNTNHISGTPLTSDGFIYLNAYVNGAAVDKQLNSLIQIAIPTTNTRTTQVWDGVEKVDNANQMAWQTPALAANGIPIKRESSPISGFYNFDMGNLGWSNCDVFFQYTSPKTTARVTLINNPGDFATMRGLTGETFVFFCTKGSNVVAQYYNVDGPNTVKSYDNMIPMGVDGKYISFSIKDGKYYLATQETTVTANQTITLTLVETTEAQVQAAITSLNNY